MGGRIGVFPGRVGELRRAGEVLTAGAFDGANGGVGMLIHSFAQCHTVFFGPLLFLVFEDVKITLVMGPRDTGRR